MRALVALTLGQVESRSTSVMARLLRPRRHCVRRSDLPAVGELFELVQVRQGQHWLRWHGDAELRDGIEPVRLGMVAGLPRVERSAHRSQLLLHSWA
jgi:hypothetical protein